jgi:hypothetical protein
MNLCLDIDNIYIKDVAFYKPIQNKIAHYKNFYKILYNIEMFTLNTLIIQVDIRDLQVIKENNIYKVSFSIDPVFLEKLKLFETKLLDNFNQITNKKIMYSFNKFINKLIYNTTNPNTNIVLRISGIWESDTQIGITNKLTVN